MIRITPYHERPNKDELRRAYLRMVAASTPFLAEDVLYDDPEGLAICRKEPKKRVWRGRTTKTAQLLHDKGVPDGTDAKGMLIAEAKLAEVVVQEYSESLHAFLYDGATSGTGHVNPKNLRKLLLLRLPHGQVPEPPESPQSYRFNDEDKRSGPQGEWNARAKLLLEYVFRYDEFSQLRPTDWHHGIHEFCEMLDVRVCPYCNRQFTTTISAKGHRVRPQLDHFRNKRSYPFLALSINNLVPACGVCNLLKLDKDKDFVYPYDEDFEMSDVVFRTTIPADHTVPALEGIPISGQDFCVELDFRDESFVTGDGERRKRVRASKDQLQLAELYQSHRDYIAFLYRQRYILTKQLAADLHDQFGELFSSPEEVEDVFALMHTDYGHWGDRPLSKLTHDILQEIEELYSQDFDDPIGY